MFYTVSSFLKTFGDLGQNYVILYVQGHFYFGRLQKKVIDLHIIIIIFL